MGTGGDITNLFELQSALQRDGKIRLSAEEEETLGGRIFFGNATHDLIHLQRLRHEIRKLFQGAEDFFSFGVSQIPHSPEHQAEHREHEHLRGEGFRGGDSDLLPGAQIDPSIALTADRAEGIVANAEGRRAPALDLSHSRERVGGLPALAQRKDRRAHFERRISIAEFAGDLALHRHAGEEFDDIFAGERRVERGAAAGEDQSLPLPQFLG